MGKLLALFIVGMIGITLRFVIWEKFEWDQVWILFLFPIAAVTVWFIRKWMLKRDLTYKPTQANSVWSTSIGERYSTGTKLLYKGSQQKAVYRRFYPNRRQHIFNEIIEGDGRWYMNLSFDFEDSRNVSFVQQRQKNKLRLNDTWNIFQDNERIGQVKTNYSLKSAATLQEGLILDINSEEYRFKSFGIGSHTELSRNGTVIGKGKRSDLLRSQYHFEVIEGHEGLESIFAMTYILFNYIHKQ